MSGSTEIMVCMWHSCALQFKPVMISEMKNGCQKMLERNFEGRKKVHLHSKVNTVDLTSGGCSMSKGISKGPDVGSKSKRTRSQVSVLSSQREHVPRRQRCH